MTSLCMYFQVHQPFRLRRFWPDDRPGFFRYFDERSNREIFERVARKCYIPANRTLLESIDEHKGEFKFSLSITGTLLEQCELWGGEVLESVRQLAETGAVEILEETFYHSLSSLFEDKTEFIEEVKEHREMVSDLLGVKPQIFRNTELLYNNSIAKIVSDLGYKAILTEGADHMLEGRSPNVLYKAKDSGLPILFRNYKLSDDIGYRFSARWWEGYPLTAEKWASWASGVKEDCINIFMDYETFGEHQWRETGIFDFVEKLPAEVLKNGLEFSTPVELTEKYLPVAEIDVGDFSTISWADMERDTSAWLGNDMQRRCFEEIRLLEPFVKKTEDPEILRIWKHLLTSDHYYYMCTKWLGDGDVHSYFSVHSTPFEAAVNFMAVLMDFKAQVFKKLSRMP
ncbi:glycoside hydrolase family 57 protein [Methanosarcina mazei]|uniref:Alpha-amylase n=5 Tax=Methanosarcina mazei TaxID=2209 RepID=A0A0F8N104_METMZ|nr:glycoside hydrolase family 57 protein [Methanosarcina mazei]AAM30558.1 Alpha-amylase [Methanosarcina mazei Go1]AKB39456.1 Alpha-amylase [Methanosarcina mazei WWM610]AKB66990.1 Alpha-amylase [Methanosarcina mazei LYC]AKB70352.1 Alpha-amylase [Methanosarcina mazei C16]KKF98194.1 alpha-amylase [Methanosarcina mazei]